MAKRIASEIFSSISTFIATTNSLAGIFARNASTTEFLPATASWADCLRSNLFSGRSGLRSSRFNSRSFTRTGFLNPFRSSRFSTLRSVTRDAFLNPLRSSRFSSLRSSLFSGRATALLSTRLLPPREKDLGPFGRSLRDLPGFINNSTLVRLLCLQQ